MEFKEKLKKLRTENGLSQEALADAVHISRSAIAKYENGNGNPSEETLMALAVYFGVEVNDLKDDSEIKRKTNKAIIKTVAIIVTSVIALGGIVTGTTFGILNNVNIVRYTYIDYELRTENISLNYYYDDVYATLLYGGCNLGHSFDSMIQPSNLIAGDVLHFDYVGKLADPIYSIPGEIDIVGRLESYHFIKTEIRNYHSDLGPIKDNLDVLCGMYQIEGLMYFLGGKCNDKPIDDIFFFNFNERNLGLIDSKLSFKESFKENTLFNLGKKIVQICDGKFFGVYLQIFVK